MRKLNWVLKIIFFINMILGLGLVLTNFSSSFEPESSSYGYILGLTYPLFLLINIGFVIFWLYHKKLHVIFSMVIILSGYSNVSRLIAINFSSPKTPDSDFKIMTFNVRLLNQYEWLDIPDIDDQIFETIQSESPDIVAFQEFIYSKKNNKNYLKRMRDLGYKYFKKEPSKKKHNNFDFFGLVTFSKFKIINHGTGYNSIEKQKNTAYFTDILIKSKTIRIYNTHLNSLGFISEDYQFVENITNSTESEAIQKSKNILTKVIRAAKKRQQEVEGILDHVNQSPHPVIVLGDFNEPPYSYAYPQFTQTLKDPFQKFGLGLGSTFDGISTIPGLRLDFILHDTNLLSTSYKTGQKNLSDHRPVIVEFSLSK